METLRAPAARPAGAAEESISLQEAVELSAVDSIFYSRFFFPQTARQKSPRFHQDMWAKLDGPSRYVSFMVFRGAGKTTLLRLYTSKRIAYALSRTILYIGKSQDHARRSVEWLMRQVETNNLWAGTFQLRKGKKWTSEEIEIYHGTDEVPIRVIALGITGSTRGINVDDWRPDLIVVDDVIDEENSLTPEQREKTEDYLLGSIKNSLSPTSESPAAKMAFLNTLLDGEDAISRCDGDPQWDSARISVFDPHGKSAWPERWSTPELRMEKASYVARGKLPLWMREMECKIVSGELSAFLPQLLQYYDILPDTHQLRCFMAIDPVPPPSERELQRGLKGKDYEAMAVVGVWQDARTGERRYYLCELAKNRGHDPDWTMAKFFELADRWNIEGTYVESTAYQRTLKWLLEKAMRMRGRWFHVSDKTDRRKKTYRIIDTIGSVIQNRQLYVHSSQSDFVEQYLAYPNVNHDDVIESVAMALELAQERCGVRLYHHDDQTLLLAEREYKPLNYRGACP